MNISEDKKDNSGLEKEAISEKLKPDIQRTRNDLGKESSYEQNQRNSLDDVIDDVNGYFLLKTLSPEVTGNEETKRKHKYILIIILAIFLVLQFVIVGTMSMFVVTYSIFNSKADLDIIKVLISFVSGYITSVIIELIAILNYIVKNVFDTSIADLIKLFKETREN